PPPRRRGSRGSALSGGVRPSPRTLRGSLGSGGDRVNIRKGRNLYLSEIEAPAIEAPAEDGETIGTLAGRRGVGRARSRAARGCCESMGSRWPRSLDVARGSSTRDGRRRSRDAWTSGARTGEPTSRTRRNEGWGRDRG